MIKHLEVKTYNYYDLKVTVEIDYDAKTISLVEHLINHPHSAIDTKKWVFKDRGLEYMNGWLNILDAMKYAIEQAREELDSHLKFIEKEKMDRVTDIFIQATDLVDQKRYKNKKNKS